MGMRPDEADFFAIIIEAMIVTTISATLASKIMDPVYEEAMREKKAKLAKMLERL